MKTLKSHLHSLAVVSLMLVGTACIKFQHIPTTGQHGTQSVSVRPQCTSTSTRSHRRTEQDGTSRVTHYEFKCGDTAILIRDNTLTVNGKSYGTLNEGDAIAIDYGKVRVNSKVRAEVR